MGNKRKEKGMGGRQLRSGEKKEKQRGGGVRKATGKKKKQSKSKRGDGELGEKGEVFG